METSAQQFEDLVARRLLVKAEGNVKQRGKLPEKQERFIASQTFEELESFPEEVTNVASEFIKIEKNLISFGFFTPSSKRIKTAKAKTIKFTRVVNGAKIEATATIVPAALYGLPIISDQDKYLALQRIISDLRKETGIVHNPITFTSAELLKLLEQTDAGKNYQEISDWLDLMSNTGIISEGAVYLAGKKKWVRDRFRVFERAVSFGRELDDGTVADKNYVWLSEWQLENINNNYLLPIDYENYKQLKNHIAKALVPLLQIWLYATREGGSFEKRYDELCQILNISPYQYRSKIKEKLGPSLDELKDKGYISDWKIEKTSDGKAYKIVFYHGDKFHRDRAKRVEQKEQREQRKLRAVPTATIEQESVPEPPIHTLSDQEKAFFKQLNMDLQVAASTAYELVKAKPEQVRIQLEAYPYHTKVKNPAGFIIEAIKQDYALPEALLEARRKAEAEIKAAQELERLRVEREAEAKAELEQMQREEEAKVRAKAFLDQMPEAERQALREQATAEVKSSDFMKAHYDSNLFESMVNHKMTSRIMQQLAETEA